MYFFDRDLLIGSAKLVHPVHVKYEKESWQNTPLLKINTYMKWLWLFIIHTTQTSGWQWSDLMANTRCLSMPYSCSILHSLSRGTRSYAFSRSTKHAKTSFACTHDFSKTFLIVKIWSVVLRPKRKPHWPSSSFDSTISRHFLSRHLAYTFSWMLRYDISWQFVHFLRSPFLYIRMIIPVCKSFGAFSSFHATWHTFVNQRTPSPLNAFNSSGWNSSLTAAFRHFNFLMTAFTYQCEDFLFPKINRITCVM